MKIWLDGCDGTGKTTLAKKLSEHFGIDIFSLTKDSEKSISRYIDIGTIDDVVCDRCFISEMIYPKIFGRNVWLDEKTFDQLLRHFRYYSGVTFVICTASNAEIINRLTSRGDEFEEVSDAVKEINAEYFRIAKEHDILLVDTETMTTDEIITSIEKEMTKKW